MVTKGKIEDVKQQIEQELGGEVVHCIEDYLVVILEAETTQILQQKFEQINQIPDVITTNLTYLSEEDLL